MRSEFDAWRPYKDVFVNERLTRVTKEAHELPIVLELSHDGNFRQRAHDWAWTRNGPTPRTMTADTWPPKYESALIWIGEYYHALYSRYLAHAPHLVTEVTTMAEAKAQALALSAANPLLIF